MIPRIIHYCWFGNNDLTPLAKKCIASWKKYMPNCEIKEWNETNYDINAIAYTKEAYKSKKYAFVSDYARFDILNEYGGIYLDVDVELLKPIDDLLSRGTILGLEEIGKVAPGLILASEANTKFLHEMIETYKEQKFILEDGKLNEKTIVDYTSEYFIKNGLKLEDVNQDIKGVSIFSTEHFCPINIKTNELLVTGNTYSIHHYASSWLSPWGKFKKEVRKKIGANLYNYLYRFKKNIKFFGLKK